MPTPVRASSTPYATPVEAGKDYWWCSCGQSKEMQIMVTQNAFDTASHLRQTP